MKQLILAATLLAMPMIASADYDYGSSNTGYDYGSSNTGYDYGGSSDGYGWYNPNGARNPKTELQELQEEMRNTPQYDSRDCYPRCGKGI